MCTVAVTQHTVDTPRLTDEGKESAEVVGHDKEGDVSEATAGLEVAKGTADTTLLATVVDEDLGGREGNVKCTRATHSPDNS